MAGGVLKIVSPDELANTERDQQQLDLEIEEAKAAEYDQAVDQLAGFVRLEYQRFRKHRTKHSINRRFLSCLRAYNGKYSPDQLAAIKGFGGSEVFAQMTAVKCRGAASLLREVFLGGVKTWTVAPTPEPELPDDTSDSIRQLVMVETQTMQAAGEEIDPKKVQQRISDLFDAARQAAMKTAKEEAAKADAKLDDIVTEGGYYQALDEFITDLTIFPIAIIKGPEFRRRLKLNWKDGQIGVEDKPTMTWRRCSPFDVYFTPGASRVEEADVIERQRLPRKEINSLLGLPGYNEAAIREALQDYDSGLTDWLDDVDTERADEEKKENPHQNDSRLIDTLEYHGAIQGSKLLDHGFSSEEIPDPDKDYHCVVWVVGRHVIKVQMNPNPRQRHPYYAASFEAVPGAIYGNALPEILMDVQDVANASFRSLVNNLSMASGPQVVVNEERLSPTTNADSMYPWKRWRTISDPLMSDSSPPVTFFQPDSNANELLGVYKAMMDIADDVSAIPRYVTGSNAMGGAASTASGLSMLMNNASKVLQNIALSIDNLVNKPLFQDLYITLMVTDDSGMLRGDEQIQVQGVSIAAAKELDRMRQLEMLQLTMNPVDMEIIGTTGRASLLRGAMKNVGLPEEAIVPSEAELQAQAQAKTDAMMQQGAARGQGEQPPQPGGQERMAEEMDNMHRTRIQ